MNEDWADQRAALLDDESPWAGQLVNFTEAWARLADELLTGTSPPAPMEALRRTLRQTEAETMRLPIGFVAQAMLMLCTHWEPALRHRDEFFDSMTPIEQNIFAEVAAVYVARQENGDGH